MKRKERTDSKYYCWLSLLYPFGKVATFSCRVWLQAIDWATCTHILLNLSLSTMKCHHPLATTITDYFFILPTLNCSVTRYSGARKRSWASVGHLCKFCQASIWGILSSSKSAKTSTHLSITSYSWILYTSEILEHLYSCMQCMFLKINSLVWNISDKKVCWCHNTKRIR